MYFKIEKGTDTFNKIQKLRESAKVCNKAACDLAIALGGDDEGNYLGSGQINILFGGLSAIKLDVKPIGWVKDKNYAGFYYPQKNLVSNAEVIQKIKELPTVKGDDLNKILNFEEQSVGKTIYFFPKIMWKNNIVIYTVQDQCKYKAPADVVEIKGSEFELLRKQIGK